MKLAEKIREEIEVCEFYPDYNAPVKIMKIFREWLREQEDCDVCTYSLTREIRRAGGYK